MTHRAGRHRSRTPKPVIAARAGIGLAVFVVSLAVVLNPQPPQREVPVAGNFTAPAQPYSLPAPPTAPPPTTTPLTTARAAPRIPSPRRSSHRVKVGKSRGVTPESAPTTSSKRKTATSTTTSAPQTRTMETSASTQEASSCPSDGITGGATEWVAIAANYIADQTGFDGTILGRGGRAGNASSDHPGGYAVDFVTDDGDELADWVLEHRDALGVTYVIWRQRYNDGSGWDEMDDRGSRTANHFDHVHVSFSRTEPDLATFLC